MEIKKITKPKSATWLDKAGLHSTYHFDSNDMGLRVFVRWMDEADTTEIRAIKGDGRRDDFEEFGEINLPGNYLAQPDRLKEEVLKLAEASFPTDNPKP